MPTTLDQDSSQRSVTWHGIGARWDQDLSTDMSGPRVEMCNEARLDVLRIAVEHEGINQAIAASVAYILRGKPVTPQIAHIVVQPEVRVFDKGAAYG